MMRMLIQIQSFRELLNATEKIELFYSPYTIEYTVQIEQKSIRGRVEVELVEYRSCTNRVEVEMVV